MTPPPRQATATPFPHLRVAVAGPWSESTEASSHSANEPPITAASLVWRLVEDLHGRDVDVSVVTHDQSADGLTMTRTNTGVTIAAAPRRSRHTMRDLLRFERRGVKDGILAIRPDLVHAHWCAEYALGALATGIPTLVTVHDWMPAVLRHMERRYLPYWSGMALLYFVTLARARHLTAVSPYTARQVRPFTRAAVEVIPNGIEDHTFRPPESVAGAPRASEERYLLSANNAWGPLKNVQRLLKAWATVRARHAGCRLVLAGIGYGPGGPCQTWASASGLDKDVVFAGSLDRDALFERLRGAQALVHPSLHENMPLTIIEAMSQGIPVLGGVRSGGVPWVLSQGSAGLLVDVSDVAALAEGMDALLSQPDLRARLAHGGYRRAWNAFRQSRVTDLYLDAYERVLDEERDRRVTR